MKMLWDLSNVWLIAGIWVNAIYVVVALLLSFADTKDTGIVVIVELPKDRHDWWERIQKVTLDIYLWPRVLIRLYDLYKHLKET